MDAKTSSCIAEENKAIVDRWLRNFWGQSYDSHIVDKLAVQSIFFHHSLHTPRVGPVSLKTFMAELREAFFDLVLERTTRLVAEGDVVMTRWVCEGSHTGPAFYDLVMGALAEASGRKMRFTGVGTIRLETGKIIEEIALADGVVRTISTALALVVQTANHGLSRRVTLDTWAGHQAAVE
jgi:predicted ester cyclase